MFTTPTVKPFYDYYTGSFQYVVYDPDTLRCAIIDPVLDLDINSGTHSTIQADRIMAFVRQHNLGVDWILDTHPHADHISAAYYLKTITGAPICIGEKVVDVQRLWRELYNMPNMDVDGHQWDYLFEDHGSFYVGNIPGYVMWTPGHTAASITYVIGDAAFINDTLFMPDSGSARADFPGGDARLLWRSIDRILRLPKDTRVYTGHDYQPGGREPLCRSSVKEQSERNFHLTRGLDEDGYVEMRMTRDRELPLPRMMLLALQINLNGGRFPDPEENGKRYLKYPLDVMHPPLPK